MRVDVSVRVSLCVRAGVHVRGVCEDFGESALNASFEEK